ncbi:MAG: hypothetical protein QOE66_1927, partial [Chloroflexota bacterium]|nr:hypothetical protein [Chloroflexota bacterium]
MPKGVRERLATLGLGLALVLGCVAPGSLSVVSVAVAAPPTNADASPRAPTIYQKSRAFRIPFNVNAAERPRLREVQLWVSDDSGFTWKPTSRTTPDRPSFTFRASRDAEYWFAVRTMDKEGKLYPGEDESVEPNLRVVIDTTPPRLVLEPDGRKGSRVAVRWEVHDEHLDLNSLVLEYQAEGAREWRQVPIRRKNLIGSETWESGTAEPLRVRGSIADKAGNRAEESIGISEGTPVNPGLSTNDPAEFSTTPPPISQISSTTTFPPPPEELPRGPADSMTYAPPPAS